MELLADFLAELLFPALFYVVGWAVGTAVLYICSWGRIVPVAKLANRNYAHLPNGKIIVRQELVCWFGVFVSIAAIVIWIVVH